MSINRGIYKENMEHIDNGILLIHTKQQICVTCSCMNVKTIIQSEVSQKEKNRYCTTWFICGIYKNVPDELICKAETETQM